MTVSLESVDSPNGWCFGFIGIYGFYKVFICCLYGFYVVFIRFLCLYIYIWFLCGFNMFFISFFISFFIWFLYGLYGLYHMVYMEYIGNIFSHDGNMILVWEYTLW